MGEGQRVRGASVGETACEGSSSGECALVRYHVHFMFMFYTPCCWHRIVVPTLRGEGVRTAFHATLIAMRQAMQGIPPTEGRY